MIGGCYLALIWLQATVCRSQKGGLNAYTQIRTDIPTSTNACENIF